MTIRSLLKLNKISFRNFLRCFTMDSEEDMLYYSHQKLSNLIRQKGDDKAVVRDYLKKLRYQPVKDFTAELEWFNVSEPLSFAKHLKGKIVVLDFFTYCCINCMHIIPDLREIEQQFSVEDGLVVIGVHSAKFANEKVSSNILSAVQRYNITHPVVNDHNSDMWKNCDVHCWPTLLILGPNANPIVMLMGEGHKENLQLYIGTALEYYKGENKISSHKLPFQSAYHLLPDLKGPLLFPGKITSFAGEDGEEILAVADSGNHRVLVIRVDGSILHEVGGNRAGFKDGSLQTAEFISPQGLAFHGKTVLYVADTDNHAIRKIDLANNYVETLAGTGQQGHDQIGGKQWTNQDISSPWDVCLYQTPDMDMTFYPDGNPPLRNVLLVAMAGTHQVWALFLEDTVWWKCKKYKAGTCLCIAGSGKEENRNNVYPLNAGFAQPSGLALSRKNKEIYIADSESSSIRRLSLVDGKVGPVVGGDRNPNNLFAFGDVDGTLFQAKLQHALGLALSPNGNTLFVADTYNHKLKKVDLSQNSVTTLPKSQGIQLKLNEPAGLCVSLASPNKLFVADTNNHIIKLVELDDTEKVRKVSKISLNLKKQEKKRDKSKLKILTCDPIEIGKSGGKLIITANFKFENNLKFAEGSPQEWSVDLPNARWSCVPQSGANATGLDVVVSVPDNEEEGFVDFLFNLVTCSRDMCMPKKFVARVPVQVGEKKKTAVEKCVSVVLGTTKIDVD